MRKRYSLLFICLITSIFVHGQKPTFEVFLRQFKEIDNLSAGAFSCTADTCINPEQVDLYLPIPPSPCNLEKDKNWRGIAKWSSGNYIVVCVNTYYDRPCAEEGYPWFEDWFVSYDKEGHVIDQIQTIKVGDRYNCDFQGTISPLKISFTQAVTRIEDLDGRKDWDTIPCDVEFFDITMDESGHFNKTTTLKSRKGQNIWNKEYNGYDLKILE